MGFLEKRKTAKRIAPVDVLAEGLPTGPLNRTTVAAASSAIIRGVQSIGLDGVKTSTARGPRNAIVGLVQDAIQGQQSCLYIDFPRDTSEWNIALGIALLNGKLSVDWSQKIIVTSDATENPIFYISTPSVLTLNDDLVNGGAHDLVTSSRSVS